MNATLLTSESGRVPLSIAQCKCCGSVYTRDEWRSLDNHRPWPEFGLEIADCTCGSTISVAVEAST